MQQMELFSDKNAFSNSTLSNKRAKEIRRFGDLDNLPYDIEEWVDFPKLVGKEIMVYGCVFRDGRYGRYVVIQFREEGDNRLKGTSTGGAVIMRKMEDAATMELFPLPGKVIKTNRYYDII